MARWFDIPTKVDGVNLLGRFLVVLHNIDIIDGPTENRMNLQWDMLDIFNAKYTKGSTPVQLLTDEQLAMGV